jgi:hypothetical protein
MRMVLKAMFALAMAGFALGSTKPVFADDLTVKNRAG